MYMYMFRAKRMKCILERDFFFCFCFGISEKKYEVAIPCSQATTMARNSSFLEHELLLIYFLI